MAIKLSLSWLTINFRQDNFIENFRGKMDNRSGFSPVGSSRIADNKNIRILFRAKAAFIHRDIIHLITQI